MTTALYNEFGPFGLPIELVHPQAKADMLGYLGGFIHAADPRPAREQFDESYRKHGGWRAMPGWQLREDSIAYPGDPPRVLVACAVLRDETINFYQGALVAIVQPDGAFEVARLD